MVTPSNQHKVVPQAEVSMTPKPLDFNGKAEKIALGVFGRTWEHDNIEKRVKPIGTRGATVLSMSTAEEKGLRLIRNLNTGPGEFLKEKAPDSMKNTPRVRGDSVLSTVRRFFGKMKIAFFELIGGKNLYTMERMISHNSSYGGAMAKLMESNGKAVTEDKLAELQLTNGIITRLEALKGSEAPKVEYEKTGGAEQVKLQTKAKVDQQKENKEHKAMQSQCDEYIKGLKDRAQVVRGDLEVKSKSYDAIETASGDMEKKVNQARAPHTQFVFTMFSEDDLTGHSVFVDLKNMTIDDMDTGVHSYSKVSQELASQTKLSKADTQALTTQKNNSRTALYAALQSKAKSLGYNMAKIEY